MSENNFQTRLRSLRGDKKKAVFARTLGVSAQDYQRYEDGRTPRADILLGIAEKTGVTVRWLLGEEDAHQSKATIQEPAPDYHTRQPFLRASAPLRENAPTCRIPEGCDIVERLDRLEAEIHTLTRLLGAALALSPTKDVEKKAG